MFESASYQRLYYIDCYDDSVEWHTLLLTSENVVVEECLGVEFREDTS